MGKKNPPARRLAGSPSLNEEFEKLKNNLHQHIRFISSLEQKLGREDHMRIAEMLQQLEGRIREAHTARQRASQMFARRIRELEEVQEDSLAVLRRIEESLRPWTWFLALAAAVVPLSIFLAILEWINRRKAAAAAAKSLK